MFKHVLKLSKVKNSNHFKDDLMRNPLYQELIKNPRRFVCIFCFYHYVDEKNLLKHYLNNNTCKNKIIQGFLDGSL